LAAADRCDRASSRRRRERAIDSVARAAADRCDILDPATVVTPTRGHSAPNLFIPKQLKDNER
jgi:hypothetical protein